MLRTLECFPHIPVLILATSRNLLLRCWNLYDPIPCDAVGSIAASLPPSQWHVRWIVYNCPLRFNYFEPSASVSNASSQSFALLRKLVFALVELSWTRTSGDLQVSARRARETRLWGWCGREHEEKKKDQTTISDTPMSKVCWGWGVGVLCATPKRKDFPQVGFEREILFVR